MVVRTPISDPSNWLGLAVYLSGPEVDLWTDPEVEPYGVVQAIVSGTQVRVATQGEPVWAKAGAPLTTGSNLLTTSGATGRLRERGDNEWHVAQYVHAGGAPTGGTVAVRVHIGRPVDDSLLGGIL